MKYRRNSDANIRELERKYQATGDIDDFLRYRHALARTSHRDILAYRRGMFLVSVSGGSFDYIKTLGPTHATLVGSWEFEGSSSPEELKKKKGRRTGFDDNTLRSWYILVPPELFSHIKTLVFEYYTDQKRKLKIKFPDHREDGMLFHAMTQWPSYQENLYKTVVGELESLGYYQPLPLPEVFCRLGCGRSMGLDTPARRYKMECFYCWQKSTGFDQKWLDEQLEYNQSHASQFRRNPLDEEIRSLEREVQAGSIEACNKLIVTYGRIGGYHDLIDVYLSHLLTELPYDLQPQNCDLHPITEIAVIKELSDGVSKGSGYFRLINIVQKYGPQGLYLVKCCKHNTWHTSLEDASTEAEKINRHLAEPLQQIYLRWRAYADQCQAWLSDPIISDEIDEFANSEDENGRRRSDEQLIKYERRLMRKAGLQPPENLTWSSCTNPYSVEFLTALIMANGPNIEEIRRFLLENLKLN